MTEPDPGAADTAAFSHDGGDVGVLLFHGFTGSPDSLRRGPTTSPPRATPSGCRCCPGTAPAGRTRTGRPSPTGWAPSRPTAELTCTCRAVVVGGLSMGGTLTLRLAEIYPDAMAGIVLVNPSVLTLRKEGKFSAGAQAPGSGLTGIAGDIAKPGVDEPGYNRTPVQGRRTRCARAWPVVRADWPGDRAGAAAALPGRPRRRAGELPGASATRSRSTDVTDIVLERSYHVATLDYDAELIFDESVAFARRVTTVSA